MLMPLKKLYMVSTVIFFTFWCLILIYFNLWFRPKAHAQEKCQLMKFYWGSFLMKFLKIDITLKGAPISKNPTLFVGNHMGYLDVPVFFTLNNATFVAKKQVSRWPIFGPATTAVGSIYVDRDSPTSRQATVVAMKNAIQKNQQSVVIFPEGTSTVSGKPWRQGALKMAQDAEVLVQPFAICYSPARAAAYIENDLFLTHLWKWVGSIKISAEIYFFEPLKITDAQKQTIEIQNLVQSKWHSINEAFERTLQKSCCNQS